MKRILSVSLTALILLSSLICLSPLAAHDCEMIYYEDFSSYGNKSGSTETLGALGWTLSEDYKKNTALYSIEDGRLICNNLEKTVGTSSDSYVTVLDNDYLSEVARGDYSYSYELTYLDAEKYDRYVCLISNYNGYTSYNSAHIRVGGYGNNQVRTASDSSKWYDHDGGMCKATSGDDTLSMQLFGLPAVTATKTSAADYPFTGRTLHVRVAVKSEEGPTVYINGVCVSAPDGKKSEVFESSTEYAQAIALKTSPKVKAAIDNITVWTGTGERPVSNEVKYTPSVNTDGQMRVMSINILGNTYTATAFEDGIKRQDRVSAFIGGYLPDVAGLQERNSGIKTVTTDKLLKSVGIFKIADEYRTDYSKTSVCQTPIIYNSLKYKLVENTSANGNLAHGAHVFYDQQGVWNKGDKAETAYKSGSHSKGFAWAVLEDVETGQRMLALNTHMAVYVASYEASGYTSAMAKEDRICNVADVMATMKKVYAEFGYMPTFFTGDFNMRATEPAYFDLLTVLSDSIDYAPDSILYEYSMTNENATITNSSFLRKANLPIDHIMFTPESMTVNSYSVLNKCAEQLVVTDHTALLVYFTLNKAQAPDCSHITGTYESTESVTFDIPEGTEVYYTTDGTSPTASGTARKYTSAISVSQDTELKYVGKAGGVYSNEMTVRMYFGQPLYITESVKHSRGSDFYEGVEMINVSSILVDLFDFRLWQKTAYDLGVYDSLTSVDVTSNMRLATEPGVYMVAPGELFYSAIFYSGHYTKTDSVGGRTVRYVTLSSDASEVTYHTDLLAASYEQYAGCKIDPERIFVVDRTARDFGYDEDGNKVYRRDYYRDEDEKDTVANLTSSFNLGNSYYNKLYLTYATDHSALDAGCTATMDGTGGGTYASGSSFASAEGAYQFMPTEGADMATVAFTKKQYSIGSLTLDQKIALSELDRSGGSKYIGGEFYELTLDKEASGAYVTVSDAKKISDNVWLVNGHSTVKIASSSACVGGISSGAGSYGEVIFSSTAGAYTYDLAALRSNAVLELTLCGDANRDGVVDMLDAMYIARFYSGYATLDDLGLLAADANADGRVDEADAELVARYIAGYADARPLWKKN